MLNLALEPFHDGEDPTRITIVLESLDQEVIDYILAHSELPFGNSDFQVKISRAGSSQIGQFDMSFCQIYIDENATPESFEPISANILGHEQEDYDILSNRLYASLNEYVAALNA